MTWAVTTPPSEEPISLADAKTHLRVRSTAEDTLIEIWIATARAHIEDVCERALMPQQWTLTRDAFPRLSACGDYLSPLVLGALARRPLAGRTSGETLAHPLAIELPGGVVTGVTSFEYEDVSGDTQTLTEGTYEFSKNKRRALVLPTLGSVWPDTFDGPDCVRITYNVGYDDAASVPAPIRAALLLMLGDLYENRKANTTEAAIMVAIENPTVDRLLRPYSKLRP